MGRGNHFILLFLCTFAWLTAKETQMYRTVFWTLWEREGGMNWENGIETCIISYKKRIASPGLMQDNRMLGAGALGRPRGMEWGGRREEGSGWGTHVYLWRIHFDTWQN